MRFGKFLLGVCIVMGAVSCTTKSESKSPIIEISHGTQYGMCLGYCYTEVIYHEDTYTTLRKSLNDSLDHPVIKQTAETSQADWKQLVEAIDLPTYYALDPVIGCPDCADGGASWVAIKTYDKSYRVTYEHGNAPAPLAPITRLLKNKLPTE